MEVKIAERRWREGGVEGEGPFWGFGTGEGLSSVLVNFLKAILLYYVDTI